MTQKLPDWDIFTPANDAVDFAEYGNLLEIARGVIDHHLPQGGYQLQHVLVHYAEGKKGDKFRMNLILASPGDGWVRITTFGSVAYASLKLQEIERAGTPNGKPTEEVFEFDQIDRGEGYMPENPGYGGLRSARGPLVRARDHQSNPRYMRELSNQILDALETEITGEVTPPSAKPSSTLDPAFFKAQQQSAKQNSKQAAAQEIKRTREETYGDW